jgi:predicted deacylase
MSAAFPWRHVPTPEAGEKQTGHIRWADRLLADLAWPYFAARGAHEGPAVLVTAAVHGGEYPGVLAARRLGRALDPARLHGSLLILPIVNLTAFWERSAFVTPQDGRNLNRLFPGRATGTFGERLAFHLTEDIITPADVVIDLHSGDIFESFALIAGRYLSGDPDVDETTRRMIEAFGLPWANTLPPTALAGSLAGAATRLGKAAMLVEVGGGGVASEEDVARDFQGLVNVLRELGVFEGQPVPAAAPRWVDPGDEPRAPLDGLWRPNVTLEQQVQSGDLLGALSDSLGEPLAEIRAERAGVVLYYCTALAVRAGDPLVGVCPPRT